MCGITGIVELNSSNPQININIEILKRMSDVAAHRGPDSDGQWISPGRQCGLSFRRLAIIDLSAAGNQPMTTPDGRFTIVFNGEIYNHKSIREELIAKGYKYRSGADTETILYGYCEYGTDIVNKLFGMWGFAIWDEQEQRLFAARDRIGIKPLYFYNQDGKLVFGSEIKSILEHPSVSRELNIEELPNYLHFTMSSRRESLFKNIRKIPSGHFLIYDKNGLQLKRYWTPLKQNLEYSRLDIKESGEELLRLLRQSIADRMMSDVPFGVFLSGGIDSSLNVALMAELMDRPVDTFTVGFKELEKYNELQYARQISELYGTNHHEVLIDDRDTLPVLEDLVWHEDEPNGDPVCIPLYFLSKLTRQSGTIVVQVGEGSDEEFAGYSWMLRDYHFYNNFWKPYIHLPGFIRKLAYHSAKPALQQLSSFLPLEFLRRAACGEEFYWSVSVITNSHQKLLFNDNFKNLTQNTSAYVSLLHSEALGYKPDADYLQRIFYVELQQRLAEILLMRVDKIGMAHSIEARVPFLDHRIVEFAMSLPPSVKLLDGKTSKYVLKNAIESILPHNIIHRKKQGFWAPVNEWMRDKWYGYVSSEILDSRLMNSSIFNKEYARRLLENHRAGKGKYGHILFTLLSLCLWHKRYFGN